MNYKSKRNIRIDGFFDYLIFHDIQGPEAIQHLEKQIWWQTDFAPKIKIELSDLLLKTNKNLEEIDFLFDPSFSKMFIQKCKEWLTKIEPIIIECLVKNYTQKMNEIDAIKKIDEICSEFTDYENMHDDELGITQRITEDPDYMFIYSHQSEQDVCFENSEDVYGRIKILREADDKLVFEGYIDLPRKIHELPFFSSYEPFCFIAKAWLTVDDLLSYPKFSDCSPLLQQLIHEQKSCENGMYFIEEDDPFCNQEERSALSEEIDALELSDCFEIGIDDLNSDGCWITVYESAFAAFNYTS